MLESLKAKEHKWTNSILIVVTLVIVLYIAYIKGILPIGPTRNVILQEAAELFPLNIKEKSHIGVNNKQIFYVTRDGIKVYDIQGEEIWSESFSLDNFVVMQKEPYIAIGSKQGKTIYLFDTEGKKAEITSSEPIVYFSVNESGSIATIANNDSEYIVSAYDEKGKRLCWRTTYMEQDGYPLVAELSPDNSKLIMAYASADEPQVISRVYAMNVKDSNTEIKDNILYGKEQKNNLVYEIEFINKNTWVAIGDKLIVWYDLEGNELGQEQNLSLVYVPYLYKMSEHGGGYLPVVISEKPTQNIVHRQDELAYFNQAGEKIFSTSLKGGIEYIYADDHGVTVQVENVFKGYNKLGNQFFEYTAQTDISKVIYIPSIRRGIAVNKESVKLLVPKKEGIESD